MKSPLVVALGFVCVFGLAGVRGRAAEAGIRPGWEVTRLLAHWSDYQDPDYLAFVEDARAEWAQVGFYGAHFWGLADTPFGKGYPAHFPARGHAECGRWFKNLNQELHARGVKVIGHINVKFLVGDPSGPEGPRGFFKFYRDQWDETLLGPKPAGDALDFLEVDRQGAPIQQSGYAIGGMKEYWACLNNPKWREVLKAWVRYAIGQGVDGLIANYFYRHDCHCAHCVAGFKKHLREGFSAEELRRRFEIADLEGHVFPEIVGWHDPGASTPLRREMLRFSQMANKRAFDEVFIEYGRLLKPDLIAGQWNHLGDFDQIRGDERCLLPGDSWGRGEDYLWYSTGGSANFTDFGAGILGEATLQARYIRGAFGDKPFTLGKYEATRVRAAIAELAANGGAPMGFYTRFTDPKARAEIVRYYQFLHRHDRLFRASRPYAEGLLIFPRTRVHAGDVQAVDAFRKAGRRLLDAHELFEVLPDDLAAAKVRARFQWVVEPAGGAEPESAARTKERMRGSRVEAGPRTRVSASWTSDGNDLVLHWVNYDRREPAEARSPGRGIEEEQPIPAREGAVDLAALFPGTVERIEWMTPEQPVPAPLPFEAAEGRVRFKTPEFLVYAVARVQIRKP